MPVRIAIGLAVTVIAVVIAGRRFHWLSRLVRAGQPAPDRTRGSLRPRGRGRGNRGGRPAQAPQVDGAGNLAHFFTMWGFTILLLTIIEAYGDLFTKYFHIPGIGTWSWIGFLEDFFIVAVLVAMVIFSIIRLKNAPARKHRLSRFYGSHTGAAWLTLAFITAVMITLLLYRRCPGGHPTDAVPLQRLGLRLAPGGQRAAPAGRRREQRPGDRLPAPEHRRHRGLLGVRVLLQAPAHLRGPASTWPSPAGRGRSGHSTRRPTWTWRT